MKEHEFTLILSETPDDAAADRLYGIIDDGTISSIADVASISFHRARPHLEDAIRSAIADVQSCGVQVRRVELEPTAVAQSA
jgi:hypothetical protein